MALLLLTFFGVYGQTVFATPKIDHWTMSNGVRVYFVPSRDLPMVSVHVVFDAGSSRDPANVPGLAMMVNAMLNEGTGEQGADSVAEGFERLGAEFGASNDRDTAGVSLRSLSEPSLLDPALDLLAKIVREPSFPQKALDRERNRAILALRQSSQSPADVASQAFFEMVYGNHPYAHRTEGSEPGLRAIQRKDLMEFHSRYYVGRSAVLAIVGDLSTRQARRIAERVIGTLPAGSVPSPIPMANSPERPVDSRTRLLPHPSSQSHILIGNVAISRDDPDYFPLYVGNYVLGGGGFVSRLMKAVRDQRGLSYSIYSYFYPLRARGPFMLGLQTKNQQRKEALSVVDRVLKAFVEEGPTDAELTAAKKNLTGGFPLRIDSNKKIGEYLAVIGFYRLPLSYLEDFIPRIEQVTAQQIREAFRRRVQSNRMATVIVGGPEKK